MARVAWVNLPNGKHANIALTYIYGIWRVTADNILDAVNIDKTRKIETLSEDELDLIREQIKNYHVEWDLRRIVAWSIKTQMEIRSYRGLRHKNKLPVRGQNTKTNAKTRKGKSSAIANKKK